MGQFEAIGHRIREARLSTGMNQKVFAERVGINSNHLSILERGDKRPSVQLLTKIADVSNVPYELLCGGETLRSINTSGSSTTHRKSEADVYALLRTLCSTVCQTSEPSNPDKYFGEPISSLSRQVGYWLYVHDNPIKYWAFDLCFLAEAHKSILRGHYIYQCFYRFLVNALYFDAEHRKNAKYSLVVFDEKSFDRCHEITAETGNLSVIQLDLENECVVRERYLCPPPNEMMAKALSNLQFKGDSREERNIDDQAVTDAQGK